MAAPGLGEGTRAERSAADLARHADELRTRGYTILRDVLTQDEVATARAALDVVFQRESSIAPRRGWLTDAYRVAYMLPAKNPLFLELSQRAELLGLVRALLGADCVLGSLNGLAMVPGGRAQPLHLDQAASMPGMVLTVNALHTLDDFTRENGCTRLVPGSNDRSWSGDPAELAAAEGESIYLEAPAGSLIAYSGGTWHAGSSNHTDQPRRALHAYFTRPWLRPHWDFPASLSAGTVRSLTAGQRTLLGFGLGPRRYDSWSDRSWLAGAPGFLARWGAILRRRLLAR